MTLCRPLELSADEIQLSPRRVQREGEGLVGGDVDAESDCYVTGAAKAAGAAGLRFPTTKAAAPKKLRARAVRWRRLRRR